jgi:hypothetical protein
MAAKLLSFITYFTVVTTIQKLHTWRLDAIAFRLIDYTGWGDNYLV